MADIILERLSPELQAMLRNLRPLTGAEIQAELNKPTSLIKNFVLSVIALELFKEFLRHVNEYTLQLMRAEMLALYKEYVKEHKLHAHPIQHEPVKNYIRPIVEIRESALDMLLKLLQKKVIVDATYKKDCEQFLRKQKDKIAPIIKRHFSNEEQQQYAETRVVDKIAVWLRKPPVTLEKLISLGVTVPALTPTAVTSTPAQRAASVNDARKMVQIFNLMQFELALVLLYKKMINDPNSTRVAAKQVAELIAEIKDDISQFQLIKESYFDKIQAINGKVKGQTLSLEKYSNELDDLISKHSGDKELGVSNKLRTAPIPGMTISKSKEAEEKEEEERQRAAMPRKKITPFKTNPFS